MWRHLHIRILLSRMGCFTEPHQDQLSTDPCIVLLALHAGTSGVGQWRTTLLDPSYLLKRAHTGAAADVGRPGAGVTSYFLPLPSDGTAAIATCTALENACCLHAFADAKMEKGQGEWRIVMQIGCRCPLSKQDALLELVRGFGATVVPDGWQKQLGLYLGPNLRASTGADSPAGADSPSSCG
jgi:hypothetical protein